MRTTQLITGSLAVVATSALIGRGTPASASTAPGASEPTTTREKGIVLECTGAFGRRPVYTSLYENSAHGNVLQVLVGRDGHRIGGSRPDADGFLDHRRVRAAMKVGHRRAVIRGTARSVGDPVPVSEEHDDAGEHITVTGTNRGLATRLHFAWQGRTVPLVCATAFRYDLQVTRESITG